MYKINFKQPPGYIKILERDLNQQLKDSLEHLEILQIQLKDFPYFERQTETSFDLPPIHQLSTETFSNYKNIITTFQTFANQIVTKSQQIQTQVNHSLDKFQ